MADYPLPGDTVGALRSYKGCSNPGLLFERLVPTLRQDSQTKGEALASVRDCPVDRQLLAAYGRRWEAAAAAAGAAVFRARTDWRLIVGLGRKGPLEVGFCFHRLYGFPVIPGSGLKGLAAAQALLVEGRDPLDGEVVAVFGRAAHPRQEGDQGAAGGAVFFDAIPDGPPVLELDIMNSHFPEYYKGICPPTDWQSPNPVSFLTVGAGSSFLFAVGRRPGSDGRVQDLALGWLKGGLSTLGVGAKTAAGYGCLVVEETASVRPAGEAGSTMPAPRAPEAPVAWRRGTVREFRSDKGRGVLVDGETGREYRFERGALEDRGWTPGKKASVEFAVEVRDGVESVCRVRRPQRSGG